MSEKPDRETLRLTIALRDLSPEEEPDDFAELVAAILAFRRLNGELEAAMAQGMRLRDPQTVHLYANGHVTPTPKFRKHAVEYLREHAAMLIKKYGG